jgi:hypothetical protein
MGWKIMPKGDKYKIFTDFLVENNSDIIELTFKDLEEITGGLPPSVYKYKLAWSDRSQHSFSFGWLRAGYSIAADFEKQRAIFRKVGLPADLGIQHPKKSQRTRNQGAQQVLSFQISEDDVNNADISVRNDPVYGSEGEAVARIIRRFPRHNSLDDIIIKLSVIDVSHSTQLFKQKQKATIIQLAQAIMDINNIDQRLENGDIDLVTQIASSTSVGFLSIASKYCACHNQYLYKKDDYFKYDSIVSGQIKYKQRNYREYCARLDQIIDDNDLRSIPRIRQKLDHYFWYNNKSKNKPNI